MERRLLLFALCLALMLMGLAVVWRSFAFKYIFQFVASGGLLVTAFYYFLRASVPGNMAKGFTFLLLSPVFFFVGELLFTIVLPPDGPFHAPAIDLFGPSRFLGTRLRAIPDLQVWHLLLGFSLFANAMVLARRPKSEVFVAANAMSLLFTLVAYMLLR